MTTEALREAMARRRALTVPESGRRALREREGVATTLDGATAEDIRARLVSACDDAVLHVWPAGLVAALLKLVSLREAHQLVVTAEVRTGMRSPTELWLLDDGIPCPRGPGPDAERATLTGLLLVQADGTDRLPGLHGGLLVAALIDTTPELVCWWPDELALGVLLAHAVESEQPVPVLPLLLATVWAALGCAACSTGAVTVGQTVCDGEPLSVMTVPVTSETVQ